MFLAAIGVLLMAQAPIDETGAAEKELRQIIQDSNNCLIPAIV